MDLSIIIKKNANIPWRVIEGEALIVSPREGLIYPLNAVAARLWELMDGQRTCGEMVAVIGEEFEVDKKTLQKDILNFVSDLVKKGLASSI